MHNVILILKLAGAYLNNGAPMASSAVICFHDALEALDRDDLRAAGSDALRSLSYSVGILHHHYIQAQKLFDAM